MHNFVAVKDFVCFRAVLVHESVQMNLCVYTIMPIADVDADVGDQQQLTASSRRQRE